MYKVNFVKTFNCLLVSTVLLFSTLVQGAESKSNLADVWKMVPNEGQSAQFESAFKAHLKFRQKQKDPRSWQTYAPVIGKDISFYIVRHCCLAWADLDSYQQWSKETGVLEHWNKNVAPYVRDYEHYLNELDFANSNWPESNKGMQYFAVTQYRVKMGKGASIAEGKKTLSSYAKEMKWPYYWSWSDQIGGKEGLSLVIPYSNYADMAPPEESFYQAIVKHLKDEDKTKAIFKQWSGNFKSTDYTIYRIRPDLSMK